MRKPVLVVATGLIAGVFILSNASAQTAAPPATATPAAAPAAAPGAAASTAPRKDPRDADGDHRASWDEYRKSMGDNFVRLDTNKDGALESAELPQDPKPQPGIKLTRAQFDGNLRAGFDRLDLDKDGYLAGDELPKAKKK